MSPLLVNIFSKHVCHCFLKLFETYLSIAILIGFCEKVAPDIIVHLRATITIEKVIEVLEGNSAILVGIEDPKSHLDITLVGEDLTINASRYELLEVDHSISIVVTRLYYIVPVELVVLAKL